MKNLLVSPDDILSIKFAVGKMKDGKIVCDISQEMLKETYGADLDVSSIETHDVVFRRPSFSDVVFLTGKLSTNDGVRIDFNPFAIRMARMSNLIKSWTLKDGETAIPATAESIQKLNPMVANIIGIQLDTELGGF